MIALWLLVVFLVVTGHWMLGLIVSLVGILFEGIK